MNHGFGCFELFLGSATMHGDTVAGPIAIPCILPLLGFQEELTSWLAALSMYHKEVLIVGFMGVFDDCLKMLCPWGYGMKRGIEPR